VRLPRSLALVAASTLIACVSEPIGPNVPCPPPAKTTEKALAAAPKADADTTRTVEVRIAPTRDGGPLVTAIEVSLRFSGPPVEFGEARPLVFSLGERGVRAEDVDELSAKDSEGSLPLTLVREDEAKAPSWRAERRARGPVTVRYTRKIPAPDAGAPDTTLAPIASGGFIAMGSAFLLVPETTEPHVIRVRWDVAGLGGEASGTSSLEPGNFETIDAPSSLASAVWAAGPLHRVSVDHPATNTSPAASLRVVAIDPSPFDPLEVGTLTSRAFQATRPLSAASNPETFNVFLLGSGVKGPRVAFKLSGENVLVRADAGTSFDWTEKRELVRTVVRARLGNMFRDEPWFDRGFVTYFALDAMAREALVTPADLLEDLDTRATRYFSSSKRTMPAAELTREHGLVAVAHAEDRSALYAAELDGAIRKKSDGKRRLADLVRELAKAEGEADPGRAPKEVLRAAIEKELGPEGVSRFEAVLERGASAPEVPEGAFGPCLSRVARKTARRYELGFDPTSTDQKKVRGLVPGSAAARAGLVEGERITAANLGDGSSNDPVELEVERNGKLVKVRFLPRGEAVSGYGFAFAPKAPPSCGAPSATRR